MFNLTFVLLHETHSYNNSKLTSFKSLSNVFINMKHMEKGKELGCNIAHSIQPNQKELGLSTKNRPNWDEPKDKKGWLEMVSNKRVWRGVRNPNLTLQSTLPSLSPNRTFSLPALLTRALLYFDPLCLVARTSCSKPRRKKGRRH